MNGPSKEWLMKMAEIEDGKCTSVGGLAVECGLYEARDPRTRWQKLRDRLFPARHCFAPDAPSEFRDCIHGRATTKLSILDRLRVLATGVIVTQWRTATENRVGQAISAAECWVGTSKDLIRQRPQASAATSEIAKGDE